MTKAEASYLKPIIEKLQAQGLTLEYSDGEDTVSFKWSLLGSCDEEWINVSDGDNFIGQLFLVHGNGGEPEEIIADYSTKLNHYLGW